MSTPTDPPALPETWTSTDSAHRDDDAWQRLPVRGARLAAIGGGFWLGLLAAVAAGFGARLAHWGSPWPWAIAAGILVAALGAWLAVKRHRRTLWKLDRDGFALQRGHWWQTETRVPISRVQHLDLKRGPLERSLRLATLVIHTAGTRLASVAVAGLDSADAERLRDRLARQLDQDDDAL